MVNPNTRACARPVIKPTKSNILRTSHGVCINQQRRNGDMRAPRSPRQFYESSKTPSPPGKTFFRTLTWPFVQSLNNPQLVLAQLQLICGVVRHRDKVHRVGVGAHVCLKLTKAEDCPVRSKFGPSATRGGLDWWFGLVLQGCHLPCLVAVKGFHSPNQSKPPTKGHVKVSSLLWGTSPTTLHSLFWINRQLPDIARIATQTAKWHNCSHKVSHCLLQFSLQ